MTIMFHDYEGYSAADLKKVGLYRYAQDPSTRALMLAYAFDGGKVNQWVPAEGEKMPRDLREAFLDPHVTKAAWNAQFERVFTKYVIGINVPFDQYRCSMIRAMTLSFPGSLEKAGEIVGLEADKAKDKEGKKFITLFCKPNKKPSKRNPFKKANYLSHPDEWERFKHYNRQDVVAERAMWSRTKRWDLPEHEWDMWHYDQQINEDGIPLNMDVVNGAIDFLEYYRTKKFAELRKITGIENPRSTVQMLSWLKKHGYKFDDLKKGHVELSAKDETLDDDLLEVLNIRLEVSRTSPDKFYAMNRSQVGGIVQGAFQFAGAQRTWRWSGRIFQPQNLPRPDKEFEECQPMLADHLSRLSPKSLEMLYPKPMDMLATAVRPTIQAPRGQMIISADLNAIENRVLGWLANDEKILDCYQKGRDPYLDFASYMYETPYEELYEEYKPADGSKGDKSKRTIGKPGTLGCGYMLSAGDEKLNKKTGEVEASGLLGYAWNMKVPFTLELSKKSVTVFRSTFTDVVAYWWEIDKAAKQCLRTGNETEAGPVRFNMDGPFMRMWLPSNRHLHYCRPRLEETATYWCREQRKYLPKHLCIDYDRNKIKYRENIFYEGQNDRNQWVDISTHPGKLTENADQAISRDLLAVGMKRFRRRVPRSEARVRLHVHDEIVAFSIDRHAEKNQAILLECMSEPVKWAPGLPLGAAGSPSMVWVKD